MTGHLWRLLIPAKKPPRQADLPLAGLVPWYEICPMIGARLFIIAAFAATVLAGCDNKPVAGGAPPPPPVTVSKPLQKSITEWDEYTGRFEALATVEVRARVSGFIESIHFRDGADRPAG